MTIDIGAAATNRAMANYANGYTVFSLDNPSNGAGDLSSIEIHAQANLTGMIKVMTGIRDGAKFTPRDSVTLAAVTGGSKQTITEDVNSDPIALAAESGDCIGIYSSGATPKLDTTGGAGLYAKSGDQSGAGEQTYSLSASMVMSLCATGAASGGGSQLVVSS